MQVSEVSIFSSNQKVLPIIIGTCVSAVVLMVIIGGKLFHGDGKCHCAVFVGELCACVA